MEIRDSCSWWQFLILEVVRVSKTNGDPLSDAHVSATLIPVH
jgi:hypothetical protein